MSEQQRECLGVSRGWDLGLEKPGDRASVGMPCLVCSAILFGNELAVIGMGHLGM